MSINMKTGLCVEEIGDLHNDPDLDFIFWIFFGEILIEWSKLQCALLRQELKAQYVLWQRKIKIRLLVSLNIVSFTSGMSQIHDFYQKIQ